MFVCVKKKMSADILLPDFLTLKYLYQYLVQKSSISQSILKMSQNKSLAVTGLCPLKNIRLINGNSRNRAD